MIPRANERYYIALSLFSYRVLSLHLVQVVSACQVMKKFRPLTIRVFCET